jgi:predicted Zn-dependent peptidase
MNRSGAHAGIRAAAVILTLAGCGSPTGRKSEGPSPVEAIRVEVDFPRQSATTTRLDNGLEVVLLENRATPLVAAVTVVGAGSRYEDVETSGASHFLEHLLFNGTERRTQEQLFDETDRIGAFNNATTGRDQTTFMMLVPAEHAGRGLDIQADMLFGSTLLLEKFEKERGILIEEIGKDSDRVENLADQAFQEALYRGTPYALPITGTIASVRAMNRDRVFEYYKNRYVPNNMTLLVIGDFRTEAMLDLVNRTFGTAAPKPLHGLEPAPPASIDRDVIQIRRGATERAYLNVGFEAPPLTSADYPAFAALAGLLGQGDNSRLNQTLRGGQTPHVYEISSFLDASRDFSRLVVRAVCPPEADMGAILQTIVTELKRFITLPPSPPELRRIVTEMRVQDISREEQLHYFGLYAAPLLANADYEFLRDYTSRLEGITPQDIGQVARTYFADAHYVASAFVPAGSPSAAGESPGGGAEPWKTTTLPNGLQLLVRSDPASPVFAAHLLVRDRAMREPPGRDGIADLLHHAMLRGTVVHRGPELADALQAIGATVKAFDDPSIPYDDYYTSPAYSYVRMETVDDYADEALRLLTEIVRQPTLRDEDVTSARDELAAQAEEAARQAAFQGRRIFTEALWPGHPYARIPAGTAETLRSITPDEVRAFRDVYFAPGNLVLAVRTGRPADSITALIGSLWDDARNPSEFRPLTLPSTPSPTAGAREKMGKQQSMIYEGRILGAVPPEDRAPLMVLASIVSGDLAFELRERRGLAYVVGLDASVEGPVGWISARMGTRPENIDAARSGLRDAIQGIGSRSFPEEEVTRAKNKILGQRLMRRMTRINQAYFACLGQLNWGDPNADTAVTDALRETTPAAVSRAASAYFRPGGILTEVIIE